MQLYVCQNHSAYSEKSYFYVAIDLRTKPGRRRTLPLIFANFQKYEDTKIVKFWPEGGRREQREKNRIDDFTSRIDILRPRLSGLTPWKVPLARERQATCATQYAISTPRAQTKNRQFISRLIDAIATSLLLHTILHHFAVLPFKFHPDRAGGSRVIADARNPTFGLVCVMKVNVFQESSTF